MSLRSFDVYAKSADTVPEVRSLIRSKGFEHRPGSPDFIVTVGGDGTYLRAESRFPGVPKILVRDSLICFKCHNEPLSEMLDLIRADRALIVEAPKLQAGIGSEWIVGTNDVVVRNVDPRHALRFRLSVAGAPIDGTLIGDGIVVATPFGSTGYYRSVSGDTFTEGIGIAYNNLSHPHAADHVRSDVAIELTVVRGMAHVAVDNNERLRTAEPGTVVTVRKADAVARFVGHI
ncbi:MAG: hypothetical protein GF331_02275 [Chitinivibrionales bacterium]|nr:hypothetical protein [Chitinivibrionales bacterium]